MVSFAVGIKGPITELYRTDNDLSLLLWRTVVNGREVWERKVYKYSRNAEKALYARTAEYMEYFSNCNKDYKIVYLVLENGEEYTF